MSQRPTIHHFHFKLKKGASVHLCSIIPPHTELFYHTESYRSVSPSEANCLCLMVLVFLHCKMAEDLDVFISILTCNHPIYPDENWLGIILQRVTILFSISVYIRCVQNIPAKIDYINIHTHNWFLVEKELKEKREQLPNMVLVHHVLPKHFLPCQV